MSIWNWWNTKRGKKIGLYAIIALPVSFIVAAQIAWPAIGSLGVPTADQQFDSSGLGTATAVLRLTTAVGNWPIIPDPGEAAYVKYTLSARNGNGTPAADAAVTMSNAKPGVTFHTNATGVLTLVEPVTVQPGSDGGTASVTANVIATTGATGRATQELYNATMQAMCSFDGQPGPDLSLLDAMLPDVFFNTSPSSIQTLIENLGPWLGGYHTTAAGFKITVPKSSNIYAQTVQITHRRSTAYSGTGYSRRPILPAGSLLQNLQDGCYATTGLA
jgi:hypothetical protein